MPEVAYAEPNGLVRRTQAATFKPDDRFYRYQWNLDQMNAERTWGIQKGKTSVAVAVLDSGVAYEDYTDPRTGQSFRKAPDWGDTQFLPGYDFVNGDAHPNDDEYHGTHVASTIAEATNNGIGMAGLAFGCAIMPVKVLDQFGEGTFFDVAEGIDYAAEYSESGTKPVKVINLSLGSEGFSQTVKNAIDRAFSGGVLVVAAAGNSGKGVVEFPANLAERPGGGRPRRAQGEGLLLEHRGGPRLRGAGRQLRPRRQRGRRSATACSSRCPTRTSWRSAATTSSATAASTGRAWRRRTWRRRRRCSSPRASPTPPRCARRSSRRRSGSAARPPTAATTPTASASSGPRRPCRGWASTSARSRRRGAHDHPPGPFSPPRPSSPSPRPSRAAGEFAIEAQAGYFEMAASNSASALFDSSGGGTFGGAVRYTFWRGAFVSAGARTFSKEGERVFVSGADAAVQKLGFPLSIRLTPIFATAGYRFRNGKMIVPYAAVGGSITSYKEESEVAGEAFDTDRTKTGFVGAAGLEVGRGTFRFGAEVGLLGGARRAGPRRRLEGLRRGRPRRRLRRRQADRRVLRQ